MPTLNIAGQRIQVGDDFLKLSPEEQAAAVEEIAGTLGGGQESAPQEQPANIQTMHGMPGEPIQAGGGLGNEMRRVGTTIDNLVRSGANGMTFGLADKFAGGMDAVTGQAPSYDAGVKAQRARTEALPPAERLTGEIAGGLAGGVGLAKSGVTLAGRVGPGLFRRFLGYGVEGAGYGAAHGAGNTYSDNPADYVENAKKGATVGAMIGGALPVAGSAAGGAYRAAGAFLGPRVEGASSGASAMLRTAAMADEAGMRNLPNMGDDAMLVDAGPAMLGLGQGAVTGTGSGRSKLVNALRERDANTVPRINQALDGAIGPAPRPSQIQADIDANVQRVIPEYNGPFDASRPVNTQAIADELDHAIQTLRGPAQQAIRRVREYLNVPRQEGLERSIPSELDTSPFALFQTRQAIDTLLETEQSARVIAQLTRARALVDTELASAVPGIKQVDAKYAELMRQGEGLQRGSQVFDSGKTAVRPADLSDEMRAGALPQGEQVGPSAVPVRVRQGARAEIDRLVGTHANDLNALERKLGTPEDWNAQKFALIFGEGPHNKVAETLGNNRRFRQAYQDIVQNSQTAQRVGAAKAMEGTQGGNVPSDTTLTGLGLRALNAMSRAIAGASTTATKNEIGEILAAEGPEVQRIARELLRTARKTGENSREINRVLSSPYWIGASSPSANRK
jgi:hypothetical protein